MSFVDLGDLSGVEPEPVNMTFTYFGSTIRVNPDLTETMLLDLYASAADADVEDGDLERPMGDQLTRGAKEQKDYIRAHIHPDDFDTFWDLAKRHRQALGDLITLTLRLVGMIAQRDPTSPPSDSSDGRPDISQNSPSGASNPDGGASADAPPWWPTGLPYNPQAATFVEKFEQEGRPDKANFVMLAQESRATASASPTG
jgi:hypothetical protein